MMPIPQVHPPDEEPPAVAAGHYGRGTRSLQDNHADCPRERGKIIHFTRRPQAIIGSDGRG